jgi:hypothetical protein
MTLSDTQRLVLSTASQHEARLAAAPAGLPAAARDAVFRSMLRNGLLAERAAPDAPVEAGKAAHANSPALPDRTEAALAPRRTLRRAAQAVLDTWDGEADRGALAGPMERLRAALAEPARAARRPREGTKREQVLAMLRRPEGASGPQLAEATGWAPHTVRGFLAGLPKRGVAVTVLERVRQVGPDKAGAKGSYTIYRVADAA